MQSATLNAPERPGKPAAPTVSESLDRVVDAAQSVVTDHVQLLKLEAETAVASAIHGAVMAGVGAGFLGIGWLFLLLAGYTLIAARLGGPAALGLLAAVNIMPGAILIAIGRGRRQGERHG